MTSESISTQQFADKMFLHRESRLVNVSKILPPNLVDLVENSRNKTRNLLKLKESDVIVLFGEQTYGLNESPKVLGKRLFAQGLKDHGIKQVELFASFDIASSEGGIYRMQLPSPNSPEGNVSINILAGWKKRKNVATSGFRSPTADELSTGIATISSLYGKTKADNINNFLERYYLNQENYAHANINILRDFERQIGLAMETFVTEDTLDTQIAQSGGMEVILFMWPDIVKHSKLNETPGVRVPEIEETPFHLYHTQDECYGRMHSQFTGMQNNEVLMDTKLFSTCMQCGHSETTTPSEVVSSGRPITWRAIPRVVAYSTFGIGDGHITGGGSIYNETAKKTANALGIPYFPITHMSKHNSLDAKSGLFYYQSPACSKGRFPVIAEKFVMEGRAAMADLLLSVGVNQLKDAINNVVDIGVTTNTKVFCPDPLPKYSEIIEV